MATKALFKQSPRDALWHLTTYNSVAKNYATAALDGVLFLLQHKAAGFPPNPPNPMFTLFLPFWWKLRVLGMEPCNLGELGQNCSGVCSGFCLPLYFCRHTDGPTWPSGFSQNSRMSEQLYSSLQVEHWRMLFDVPEPMPDITLVTAKRSVAPGSATSRAHQILEKHL
eukprot:6209252-Amphidinium_carterae.1